MHPAEAPPNRRVHARFPLGLPVKLHVAGRSRPMIVEIVDLSVGGVRLRSMEDGARVADRAMLSFVLPDQRACVAGGLVSRAQRGGEFVLSLDQTNEAFRAFLASLDAERL